MVFLHRHRYYARLSPLMPTIPLRFGYKESREKSQNKVYLGFGKVYDPHY